MLPPFRTHKDIEAWLQTTAGKQATPDEIRSVALEALRFRSNQRAQSLAQVGSMRSAQAAQQGGTPAPAPSPDNLAAQPGLPVAKLKEIMRLARGGTPDEQSKAQRILAGQARRRQ